LRSRCSRGYRVTNIGVTIDDDLKRRRASKQFAVIRERNLYASDFTELAEGFAGIAAPEHGGFHTACCASLLKNGSESDSHSSTVVCLGAGAQLQDAQAGENGEVVYSSDDRGTLNADSLYD
jgi:hypothetical protein